MTTETTEKPKEEKWIRNIVIDTLNGVQNDEFTELSKKPNFDIWYDFGKDVLQLYLHLKTLPNVVLVQILGREGSGKTVGGMFLNPDETVWLNTDKKPLSFIGAKKMYPVDGSKKNYFTPNTYKQIETLITGASKKSKDPLIIYILGHIEEFKSGVESRERLKVLGKMATKLNVEGGLIHTYYTDIDVSKQGNDPSRYRLSTMNSGFNTARSPMGMWEESYIANNYQLITDKIVKEWSDQ